MRSMGEIIKGRELYFAESTWSVKQTVEYMSKRRVGALPVTEKGKLVGIFSERDLMTRVVAQGLSPQDTSINQVMTRELVIAHPDESQVSALRKMHIAKCRHLPVMEGKKLIGTISLRELLLIDLEDKTEEIRELSEYLYQNPGNE